MASSWVERRRTAAGTSYRVKFRVGGRESTPRYAGAFRTMREAKIRRDWVAGELTAMRVPRIELVADSIPDTLKVVGERWRTSRVDVADATAITHRTNLARVLKHVSDKPVDRITTADVAKLVTAMYEGGAARESIRKTLATFAMVLDFAGVTPQLKPTQTRNPCRFVTAAALSPLPPRLPQYLSLNHAKTEDPSELDGLQGVERRSNHASPRGAHPRVPLRGQNRPLAGAF